jgi:hypothetical protein
MLRQLLEELGSRGVSVLIGMTIGAIITGLIARWRLTRERRKILAGDARDSVSIHLHLIEPVEYTDPEQPSSPRTRPGTLRIRSLGQGELHLVVPNRHLAGVLRKRAMSATPRNTLISMVGPEGSYLLETLTGFVCDRLCNAPFQHELYVMAPCCEPPGLAEHQPITIILISIADLLLFDSWNHCRDVKVEFGIHGARILTLMALAQKFQMEQAEIARRRKEGQRTRFVETMYVLDLPLDRRTSCPGTKPVPWGRFEKVLRELNLE